MSEETPLSNPLAHLPGFNCFACSPHHDKGLKLNFFAKDDAVIARFLPRDDLSGIPNILHGGIQATLLDEIMWWTVFHFKQRFCVTQDIAVRFKAAVKTGTPVLLSGRIAGVEKNLIKVAGELRTGDRLLAEADGSYYLPNARMIARVQGMKAQDLPSELVRYLEED